MSQVDQGMYSLCLVFAFLGFVFWGIQLSWYEEIQVTYENPLMGGELRSPDNNEHQPVNQMNEPPYVLQAQSRPQMTVSIFTTL